MSALRVAGIVLVGGLAIGGCDVGPTTEFCAPACDVWASCGAWDRAACVAACEDDGDWDEGYLRCLEAQSCATLEVCG